MLLKLVEGLPIETFFRAGILSIDCYYRLIYLVHRVIKYLEFIDMALHADGDLIIL